MEKSYYEVGKEYEYNVRFDVIEKDVDWEKLYNRNENVKNGKELNFN